MSTIQRAPVFFTAFTILAKKSGFDALYVDLEYGVIHEGAVGPIAQAARKAGIAALVGARAAHRMRQGDRRDQPGGAARRAVVGTRVERNDAATRFDADDVAGFGAERSEIERMHGCNRHRLDRVEDGRTARDRAGMPVLELAAGDEHERKLAVRLLRCGLNRDFFEGPDGGIVAILNTRAFNPAACVTENKNVRKDCFGQHELLCPNRRVFCGRSNLGFAKWAELSRNWRAQRHGLGNAVQI